ncbi:hypothetical protein PK98_14105 [Croceibacterium mercuriale]|uniref:Lipoprotein n=1 Tax=Croceibacterium mercuriale TaxID=1572751 RepID=A0A0B2BTT6_9SPHN|nr:hypothetical protein [Croceibacterium mercuriale]KHL24973.1 hypothetical protein PK98_14105 [Croceibacterium mercuriale]
MAFTQAGLCLPIDPEVRMNRINRVLPAAVLLLVAACDGPQEQAGETADVASGAVESEDSMTSGPAETLGERADEAAESAAEAVDARADALEERADAQRDAADRQAEALEQQAEQVRGR